MEKLRGASIQDGGNSRTLERSEVNFVNPNNNSKRNRQGAPRGQPRQFSSNDKYQSKNKCRACQSPEHFVRNCLTHFCQACGARGYDAWNSACPNYEQ